MQRMNRREFICAGASLLPLAMLPGQGLLAQGEVPPSYPGGEESAAWREAALARIELHRKGSFRLRFQDQGGQPIRGIRVRGELYRHHFGFGAAVEPSRIYSLAPGNAEQFLERAKRSFHKITITNSLKWRQYERNKHHVRRFLDWCRLQQFPVRGHTLVWGDYDKSFNGTEEEIEAIRSRFESAPETLRQLIAIRIIERAGRYKAPITEWDVLNEPRTENAFMNLLGNSAVLDWFRLAERLNPQATRYVNEYAVLTRNFCEEINRNNCEESGNRPHRESDSYFAYIQELLAGQVPLQGIGFQCHIPYNFAPTPPEDIYNRIERFASLGPELQVTEFDYEIKEEGALSAEELQQQARYTRDFLITVFSHPKMVGLITWTPFDAPGNVAKRNAAMWNWNAPSLTAKPNGEMWDEWVNNQWKTRVDATTDAEGVVGFRGFKGKYKLRTESIQSAQFHAELVNENDEIHVII